MIFFYSFSLALSLFLFTIPMASNLCFILYHSISILNFIYRFDKISSEEFIKCYSTFNQKVTGKLRYQNQIYEYEVNAGGWITLNSKEKSILLGSKNKKDTLSNFISVYYCDEDWN